MHEHFSWMKWNIQYTTNTYMIENTSFRSKQHENLPMSQFSSDRTSQGISQKAVVVGCLIFSISIGHGMAIVPYNAATCSHSSWTLAQITRNKNLLYIPEIAHPIPARQETACPHMFKTESVTDLRCLPEFPLLFTCTPSPSSSFHVCICSAASRNPCLAPGYNK